MKSNYKRLGDLISPISIKNSDLRTTDLRGVNYQKYFMPSVANTVGVDLSTYKLIEKGQFACNLMHVGRDECLPIALHREELPIIVSPAYFTFQVKDENQILSEFLFLWFRRKEFDRQACFYTDADVRQGLIKSAFLDMEIPVPSIEEQRKIVAEYQAIEQRIENNRCLIATLEATAQTIYRKMFVDDIDPENLPEGWRMGTLENITLFISAGTIPNYAEDSDCLVLGQKCNYGHTISIEKARHHLPKASSISCLFGDVLVNSTGDGTLGRVGLIRFEPQNLTFDSNMTLARPLNREWIEYVFVTIMNMESFFVQICQGSTNQTRLYCSMIRSTPCLIPNKESVMNYHAATKSIFHYQGQLEHEIIILATIQKNTLSKLSNL
ncbi:restriction endonuclease subunit S [Coprobacter sp.]|uniref:restriction endonuclease subunit S n=1 Tax=Coprobacter sp. TaxID=1941478 RepID=UPI003AB5AE31